MAALTRRHRNERIAAAILILLCIAGVAALRISSRKQDAEFRKDVRYIPKPDTITPEVLLLREYVRIDTSTPRGAADGARWLAAQLAKRGIRAEIVESAPDRLNVYARIKGTEPGEGLLLFNHIDVVPPGDGWALAPFEGTIAANMLHGRGTLDMKALAICQLLAFADVARSGRAPRHDLVFLATADEETGSRYGMRWLLANRPDIFEGIGYGITEGGITEMLSEQMTYFGIEVGGKQLVTVRFFDDDPEVLRRLRFALEPRFASREPDRVLPIVRQYFRDLAPSRVAFGDELADIDGAIRAGEFWRLPPAYRELTQNTMWATNPVRHGEQWAITVRLMNLPDENPDEHIARLRAIAAPFGVTTVVSGKEGPVPTSPGDTRLFAILTEAASTRYRTRSGLQILYRSLTDARFLRPRGIICYGISPYPVDFFQSVSIHKKNERIRLDWFRQGVEYTRDVVRQWAFEPAGQ
jgi:acetylornithine deacetylase/succinyl-diaminopimelate desuccinylase-like protein